MICELLPFKTKRFDYIIHLEITDTCWDPSPSVDISTPAIISILPYDILNISSSCVVQQSTITVTYVGQSWRILYVPKRVHGQRRTLACATQTVYFQYVSRFDPWIVILVCSQTRLQFPHLYSPSPYIGYNIFWYFFSSIQLDLIQIPFGGVC